MRGKSVPFVCMQVTLLLSLAYCVGIGLYKGTYPVKAFFVAAQVGGTEKFNQLRDDARQHAKEFVRTHGGSAWFEWDELDRGQPTVYVKLNLMESYHIYPDGRVEGGEKR